MKRGDIGRWTNVENCRNLLFFAQLINELLFDYSIPSNRISTLNSHYLCWDAISTIKTIEKNGVPEGTLKPIIEELYRSLSKDITFSSRGEDPLKYFLKAQPNGEYKPTQNTDALTFDDSKKIVYSLYQKYFESGWYKKSLKTDIRKLVVENKEEDLLNLFRQTKSWLTQLVNDGYSAKFISIQANKHFYPRINTIDNPEIIDDFLGIFNGQEQKYQVVFRVNKQHQRFIKTLDGVELLETLQAKGASSFEAEFLRKKNHDKFIILERKGLDPFSAAESGRHLLLDNAAIYRLYDHNYKFNKSELKCGVYNEQDYFFSISEEASAVQRAKTPRKEMFQEKLGNIETAVLESIKRKNVTEFLSLMNAIRAHSLSLDSDSEQNQLLDLWSIFETILDISNKHTSDRILQVCTYLVPILKRKYFYSLFSQLAYDIKNYSEQSYLSIVNGATDEFNEIRKLCEFILLDTRKAERDTFLISCSDFPLLKERIEYYHQQLSSPLNIYGFAAKHSERVRWQVMRIYRNRNLIIHNGKASPYLKLLVENLHSYVDDFLEHVIQNMTKGYDLTTMCQELFVQECDWRNHFENRKAVLTSELIEEMLKQ